MDGTNPSTEGNINMSYKPYKEWTSLTSEQRKEIHKARGEAQTKGIKNWNQKKKETDVKAEDKFNKETIKPRSKKRPHRVMFQGDDGNKEMMRWELMNDNYQKMRPWTENNSLNLVENIQKDLCLSNLQIGHLKTEEILYKILFICHLLECLLQHQMNSVMMKTH